MSLSHLADFGEFVGGLAVLVTLLYLALQVRQGNQLSRSEATRTFMREYNETLESIRQPDFVAIWRLATKDFEGLPRNDQTRVAVWLEQLLRTGYAGFIVDPQEANPMTRLVNTTLASLIRLPGFWQWWERYSTAYEELCPEYLRKIEAIGIAFPSVYEFAPWLEPLVDEAPGTAHS